MPHLPLELIWLIVEQILLHDTSKDKYILAIPTHLITLNRVIYGLVTKLAYRTIILPSSRALAKFVSLLTNSPNIADLVRNIWIGTPRLEAFAHQVGWVPCAVQRLLERAKNVKRLALPAAFFPPSSDRVAVCYLTVSGSGVMEPLKDTNTLHVYGLPQPAVVRGSQQKGLRKVVCELKRPCAPGAVGQLVRNLLEDSGMELELELSVPEGLGAWLDEELIEVRQICLYGNLKLRTNRTIHTDESSCDRWVRECASS
ncbi:hypothetical protein FRC09_008600 [Ceratobasidium sp. 395]|nr:hypothetical protein FRC09_008600 [Ceratobasidium sp. 395]